MKKFIFSFALLGAFSLNAQTSEPALELDNHIYTHYSMQQIADMSSLELKKLNHYYKNSFIVVPSGLIKDAGAQPLDISTIDASRFESQRLDNERKTILISANDDQLILKSKKELEEEYKLIK